MTHAQRCPPQHASQPGTHLAAGAQGQAEKLFRKRADRPFPAELPSRELEGRGGRRKAESPNPSDKAGEEHEAASNLCVLFSFSAGALKLCPKASSPPALWFPWISQLPHFPSHDQLLFYQKSTATL